jgi:hypothetical protein
MKRLWNLTQLGAPIGFFPHLKKEAAAAAKSLGWW